MRDEAALTPLEVAEILKISKGLYMKFQKGENLISIGWRIRFDLN